MHPELFLLIGISISMGFTPGPNNAVASYSAFNFGFRKTLPIIFGVGLGYTALVILLILVLISVFQKYPNSDGQGGYHESFQSNSREIICNGV